MPRHLGPRVTAVFAYCGKTADAPPDRDDEELRAIIAAGSRYVFDTDGKKLHVATCGWMRGMRLGTPKLALDDAEGAAALSLARRGQTCPNCVGGQILGGGGIRTRGRVAPSPVLKMGRGVSGFGSV